MNNYTKLTELLLNGATAKTAAEAIGVSESRVRAMVKLLNREGIMVSFPSKRIDLTAALAAYEKLTGKSPTPPTVPKLTKSQEEARATTLKALREMYNEPEGTYEELNARLNAAAPKE